MIAQIFISKIAQKVFPIYSQVEELTLAKKVLAKYP